MSLRSAGWPRRSRRVSDRRSQRLAALVESLSVAHLDGLLVTSLPNIRYLTGFSGTSALLFVTARDAFLVTDFRYQTQVRAEVGDLARVSIESQSLWAGLWQLLAQASYVEVAGFESSHIVHRDFQRLVEAGARPRWRATSDLVETLRERKDASEVERIRSAASMATTALEKTLPAIKSGMTELEIAGVLEKSIRDAGSEAFPFPSIVASGPRSALPHARSSARQVTRGDFLLMDLARRRAAIAPTSRGRSLSAGRVTSNAQYTTWCGRRTSWRLARSGQGCGGERRMRSRATTLSAVGTVRSLATASGTDSGSKCTKRRGSPAPPMECCLPERS